eukprot:4391021-Pleurochrysis_carterae.AAC.2
MEPQRTSTAMLEGKDMAALFACSPTRCAASARYAYTAASVRVSHMEMKRALANRDAAERSDASRAEAKGAASTNSPRSF